MSNGRTGFSLSGTCECWSTWSTWRHLCGSRILDFHPWTEKWCSGCILKLPWSVTMANCTLATHFDLGRDQNGIPYPSDKLSELRATRWNAPRRANRFNTDRLVFYLFCSWKVTVTYKNTTVSCRSPFVRLPGYLLKIFPLPPGG